MADKFLRGAMILTMAGLMVKILGSVNRILLSRLLGGEGIGLYQMAYPVFLLMLSVSSAGIPIAISIIVSEKVAKGQFKAAEQVFKISLGLMVVTGLCFALTLFFGAGWLVESGFVRDPRAYYGLIALTPAVFFSTILASFRGLNAGGVFFHNSCQLPRLFSGLSDDDAACRIADFGAVYTRCNHGCAGLLPAAVRFGIRRCRGCVRCRARGNNRPYCAQLFFQAVA